MIKMKLISYLKWKCKCINASNRWKKRNLHNSVQISPVILEDRVTVGKYSYGNINIASFSDECTLIIGCFCSLAAEVTFLLGGKHNLNTISTFPYKAKIMGAKQEYYDCYTTIVSDDVWIGYGATIMSGVCIGQGAVVAAGAVVTENVPPYAIVGGIPAKVIKYRFSEELIAELLKVDYSNLTREMIDAHMNDLYSELLDINQLDWLPRKVNK